METFRFKHSGARERAIACLFWLPAMAVMAVFLWMMIDVVSTGWAVLDWSFLTDEPLDSGRGGGIAPVLVSTAWILMICLAAALPVALLSGILLAEYTRRNHRFARWVSHSLDVLASVPSIVFGLFGNAFFCLFLGMGYSIVAGGLTLACMILPILIRTTEQGFRAIPNHYRYSAMALGFSQFSAIWRIFTPMAAPAILAGIVLGLGRAAAETAALLFTSGYVNRMPESVLDSGRAISVHIYDLSMHVNGAEPQAYASAFLLLVMVLMINLVTIWIGKKWQ